MSGDRRSDRSLPNDLASVDASGDTVHNRLRLVRIERGISRRDLAAALGVHYQTIGYLERGEYRPSLQVALQIAAYFDLPVEEIFSLRPFPRIGDRARSA